MAIHLKHAGTKGSQIGFMQIIALDLVVTADYAKRPTSWAHHFLFLLIQKVLLPIVPKLLLSQCMTVSHQSNTWTAMRRLFFPGICSFPAIFDKLCLKYQKAK